MALGVKVKAFALLDSLRSLVKRLPAGVLIISIITTLLVTIWFRKGMMMATGESGIPFYNPSNFYEMSSYAWYGQHGTYTFTAVAGRYFYFLVSLLQSTGIPKFLTQALVFWALLMIQGIPIYKIVKVILKNPKEVAATSSALFYMLNPYAMYIWGRFDYTLIFLYALIPPSLYLFIRGLREHRIKDAIYLALLSFGFAFTFSTITQLFTYWLILFSYFCYHMLTNRSKKEVVFGFCFLAISLALFVALNFWWISQLFTIELEYYPGGPLGGEPISFKPETNLAILYGASKSLGLMVNILRLIHPGLIYTLEVPRGYIYSLGVFELMSFLPPIICFTALLFRRNLNKFSIYFALIAVLGLFLSKGVADPFGGLFEYIFMNFTPFQVYRNPFEKLTFIATLGYSILFGLGLSSLIEWIKKNVRNIIAGVELPKLSISATVLICFLVSGIYVWPMWTGTLFMSGQYPQNNPEVGYYVKVPAYYEELNEWLKHQDRKDYGLLILPLTGLGITYDWEYGYSGTVPGIELFDKPSIPGYVQETIPHLSNLTHAIDNALLKTDEFWKILALTNIKYVIVSWDRNYTARPGTLPPSLISKALNYTQTASIKGGLVDTNSSAVKQLTYSVADIVYVWGGKETKHSLDLYDTKQSNFSIVFSGLPEVWPEEFKHRIAFNYLLSGDSKNWSDANYLLIWLKSNVTLSAWIGVPDDYGNGYSWLIRLDKDDVNKWRLLVLPLNLPDKSKGQLNLASVKSLNFYFGFDENVPFSIKTGGIFVDKGMLKKAKYINYVRSFGKLDVYELQDNRFLGKIYATNRFMILKDFQELINTLEDESFIPGEVVAFLKSQSDVNNVEFLSSLELDEEHYIPELVYKQVNPTRYIVSVKNATKPYFLILSQTYHPQWKAFINSEEISTKYHFITNGYANAWYVNKCGSYTITIEFYPRRYIELGSLTSLVGLAICLISIIYIHRCSLKRLVLNRFRRR